MAGRRFLHGIAAVAALALSSCVYPFNPDIETSDSRIVVEGSISIGATSTFKFARVLPFSENYADARNLEMTGYIEGEDGTRMESYYGNWDDAVVVFTETTRADRPSGDWYGGSYAQPRYVLAFDTSAASPSQRYRAHFEDRVSGAVYETDWLDVCAAPVIDDLSYILDRERSELDVALSMHSTTDSHFRWYYEETWEYHSDLYASHYLVPEYLFSDTGVYQPGRAIFEFTGGQNKYNCWDTFRSPEIKIFSTSDQSENRFTDLEFHRVSSTNQKLQVLYKLTVYLEAISENAYLYWKNIEDNTNNQGSLFSPVPSQMAGNIHCLSDPSAEVIGYVGAAQMAVASMYYDDFKEKFYNGPGIDWANLVIEEFTDINEFATWYARGYLPYTVIPADMSESGKRTYQWSKARCVDCTWQGGTKQKPKDWPNTHQ